MNRIAIIESSKFALHFGDRMRDELSDIQLAMLAIYVENRDDTAAGSLLRELFEPHINVVLALLKERSSPSLADCLDSDGPACSTGYSSEDEVSAMLDRRDRARSCK